MSDGLVDHYIPSEVASPSGAKVLTVHNCVFMLDTYLPDMSVIYTNSLNLPD